MTIEYKIGDCLELMKELPDNSVNLVIADPPYFKIVGDKWDSQWNTLDEYIDWIETVSLEIKRVLADNGSVYMFADDHRAAYIQVRLDQHFTFLNHLVWYKRNNLPIKYAHNQKKYCPVSERILFYSLQDTTGLERVMLDTTNFQPLRQYFKEFQEALGMNKKQILEAVGQCADHCFRWGSTQWDMPTEETYKELCQLPLKNEFMRKEYEELREEYEELRRPFNYAKGMYEVFDIPIINESENTSHSTTKPKELIKQLIQNSSNEGDLILDPFLGSGTTLRACRETNRRGIGFEKEEK